jgi:hypothetical protein
LSKFEQPKQSTPTQEQVFAIGLEDFHLVMFGTRLAMALPVLINRCREAFRRRAVHVWDGSKADVISWLSGARRMVVIFSN